MKNLFTAIAGSALIATGAAATFVAPAQANTAQCSTTDVSLLIPVETDATACAGPIDGNDTGNSTFLSDLNNDQYFANLLDPTLTWSLLGKSDEGGDTVFGQNGLIEGGFNFTTASPIDKFIITLKSNDFFSAYLFDNFQAAQAFVGEYKTIGVSLNQKGKAQELSHLSVFVADKNDDPTDVPEPATLLGIGLMAGGMVAARRRKAK